VKLLLYFTVIAYPCCFFVPALKYYYAATGYFCCCVASLLLPASLLFVGFIFVLPAAAGYPYLVGVTALLKSCCCFYLGCCGSCY